MKKTIWGLALLLGLASCSGNKSDNEMDAFINDLMGKMTLEEKLGQLNLPVTGDIVTGAAQSSNVAENIRAGRVGGLFNLKGAGRVAELQRIAVEESRLGIPLIFGMDVIHGYETVFPIPLGLSCTWDMEAIERSAQIAAQEATADGICWTFSPMVDICHDARWGRISEGNGEDPFLGSRIAEAMVRGYQQGDLTSANTMMACVKHFALYGAPEAGRDYNTVDMSLWRMYNEYFPPYKAACDAGAGSYMASFNIVNGVPATGNRWLLTDVLRKQWGFDGFVVSDYTGIYEMIAHGMGDLKEVSALALHAGLDMDMVSDGLVGTLAESLKEGRTTQADIDQACRRILEAKYKLGLFEDPYRYCDTTRYAKEVYTEENRREARRIAGESFVLLKNEGNILPLKRQGKIALIGPLANTRANMPGTWSVAATSERYSTVVEGLKRAVGDKAQVLYAKGCNLMYDAQAEADATMFGREMRDNRSDAAMRAEALAIARQANVIVFAGGEASEMAGECSSRVGIEMPDAQHDLLVELVKLGKPIVLLNFSGRPMILNWETEHIPAILEVWFGGSEAADAIADVVFGDVVPSGKLTTSFPRHVGQLPMSYSYYNTGRPVQADAFVKFQSCYMDVSNTPLYPFGYGLSYTTFEYSNLKVDKTDFGVNDELTVTVDVKNTGSVAGKEPVLLYSSDVVASIVPDNRRLRCFDKVDLNPGESTTVTFKLPAKNLAFVNEDGKWTLEEGEFILKVGQLTQSVNCTTTKVWDEPNI